jgi:hypothetical protein
MSLRIDELAAGRLDVEELERLVADLEGLDTRLSGQAAELRRRAARLRADEGHARPRP